MVSPAIGAIVLVPFPFSDLSEAKLRPALVLADAGKGDWVLSQMTLLVRQAGLLTPEAFARSLEAVLRLLRG